MLCAPLCVLCVATYRVEANFGANIVICFQDGFRFRQLLLPQLLKCGN